MVRDEHQAEIDCPLSPEGVTHAPNRYSAAVLEHSLDAYIVIDSSDVIRVDREAEATFG
jgi:hypothetical protein